MENDNTKNKLADGKRSASVPGSAGDIFKAPESMADHAFMAAAAKMTTDNFMSAVCGHLMARSIQARNMELMDFSVELANQWNAEKHKWLA